MEPARKFDQPRTWSSPSRDPVTYSDEMERQTPEREVPEWETKLGKVIFYLTVALGLWFFYWLNGIQCPC